MIVSFTISLFTVFPVGHDQISLSQPRDQRQLLKSWDDVKNISYRKIENQNGIDSLRQLA